MIAQTHRKGFGVQACKYVRVNHSMTYFASLKSAQICLLLWLADPKPQPIRSRTYKWAWHLCEKFEPSPGEKGLPWPHCMKLKKVWRKSGESLEKVWISLKKVWRKSEETLNIFWTYPEPTLNILWRCAEYLTKSQKYHWICDSPTWIQEMLAHLKNSFILKGAYY